MSRQELRHMHNKRDGARRQAMLTTSRHSNAGL